MTSADSTQPNDERSVVDEIYECLDLDNPKSFFLFAGAGSGKTRTLVDVLEQLQDSSIKRLQFKGQRVAIITYTNAACDEIKRRLKFDPSFAVSTIHSFSWELIKPYQSDIREWLRALLVSDIEKLEDAQTRGRSGTKASLDRPRQIASKQKRLESLDSIRKFTYDPNGDNITRDSMNHAEVIQLTADFLLDKSLLQKILISTFPILLIDESQDTKKELMEAFFAIQSLHSNSFTLGLLGDTMQRIYTDGKLDLGTNIPESWAQPEKTVNYRSQQRIISLINKIRSDVDDHIQTVYRTDGEGVVRLFIKDTNSTVNKSEYELAVAKKMAEFSSDNNWIEPGTHVKFLTLEHRMAAVRGGFEKFFVPLYAVDRLKTGLLDGTLPSVSLFASRILPLIEAKQKGDEFAVAQVVRKQSPLLSKEVLRRSENPNAEILGANEAVGALFILWNGSESPKLAEILHEVHRSGLFVIPEKLQTIASRSPEQSEQDVVEEDVSDRDEVIDAWDEALQSTFDEFREYVKYNSDQTRFGTHQGIKGLEFPRVVVILDDEEARGFLFSYDKLFGVKAPTATDVRNLAEGKETGIERTRRLFYVTCSRAEESLAIIAYSKEPRKVKEFVIAKGWFDDTEIIDDLL